MKTKAEEHRPCYFIASAHDAPFYVMKWPDSFNVVSIREAEQDEAPIDSVRELCLSLIVRRFHDISRSMAGCVAPAREDVEEVLNWSRNKKRFLVHCAAGISRSSATAYIIACTRMSPKEATKIWKPHRHWPNPLIVRLGSEILGNQDVFREFDEWRKDVRLQEATSYRRTRIIPDDIPDDRLAAFLNEALNVE